MPNVRNGWKAAIDLGHNLNVRFIHEHDVQDHVKAADYAVPKGLISDGSIALDYSGDPSRIFYFVKWPRLAPPGLSHSFERLILGIQRVGKLLVNLERFWTTKAKNDPGRSICADGRRRQTSVRLILDRNFA